MKNLFRKFSKIVFFLSMLVLFVGVPMATAQAMQVSDSPPVQAAEVPDLDSLVISLKNLGGIALLFTAAINGLKKFGVVKDGQAPAYSLVLNLTALVILMALQLTGRSDVIPVIDQNAGMLATALTSVIALAYQVYVSRKGHEVALKGMPFIGASFSKGK